MYAFAARTGAVPEGTNPIRKIDKFKEHRRERNLPFAKNADPFSAVIHCTCDENFDSKTISKWARALRYVAHCMVPRARLKTFMKEASGVNACATRYAKLEQGRNRRN
jgi:hypothetical protein